MKNSVRLLMIGALIVSSIRVAQAQAVVGGGIAYGTEVDEVGIAIDGEFFLNPNLSLSPDFIIYFVDDGPDFKSGFWEFNTNANFNLTGSESATLYGLGGLNISTSTTKPDGGDRRSDTELGLNLGIGSRFNVSSTIQPFTEFKFVIGDYDQIVLMFGLHFSLE